MDHAQFETDKLERNVKGNDKTQQDREKRREEKRRKEKERKKEIESWRERERKTASVSCVSMGENFVLSVFEERKRDVQVGFNCKLERI